MEESEESMHAMAQITKVVLIRGGLEAPLHLSKTCTMTGSLHRVVTSPVDFSLSPVVTYPEPLAESIADITGMAQLE